MSTLITTDELARQRNREVLTIATFSLIVTTFFLTNYLFTDSSFMEGAFWVSLFAGFFSTAFWYISDSILFRISLRWHPVKGESRND